MILPVKIALIGNMNNNFFVLARFLRDEGYECTVFVLPYEPKHFSPEADTYNPEDLTLVKRLPWGNAADLVQTSIADIKSMFANYTHFIGCGTAPSFLQKAGIRLDIFIPYGSDLYLLPFKWPRNVLKWVNHLSFIKHQRKGIRQAKFCSYADANELFHQCLKRLRFKGQSLRSGVPMVYLPKSNENLKSTNSFEYLKKGESLIIIHQSRHCWKDEVDPISLKDNNKLIEGIALFRKSNPDKPVTLITLEYGKDVPATKQLVHALGIDDCVVWLPLMERKMLMEAVALSDIVAGEFRNSWFTYGVVFEAMAKGKPIMHFRDDSLYPDLKLYPMLYAREPQEISEVIACYYHNRAALEEIGASGKEWYLNNSVQAALSDIRKVLL